MNGPAVIGLMVWFFILGWWARAVWSKTRPKTLAEAEDRTFAAQMAALRRATGKARAEIAKSVLGVPAKWNEDVPAQARTGLTSQRGRRGPGGTGPDRVGPSLPDEKGDR